MMTDARVEGAPVPADDAAIEIQDLVVSYRRKRAVDGLDLTVLRGSVYGFLGPNGAGKTSTIMVSLTTAAVPLLVALRVFERKAY